MASDRILSFTILVHIHIHVCVCVCQYGCVFPISTDSLPALDILQQPSSKDDEDEDDDEEDDDDTEDPLAHVQDMIADDDDDADADAEETEGEDDGDGEGRNRSAEANAERGDEEGDEQPAHRATIRPLENLAAIEPERHLSKKELKRQELEELDSILAEFGIDATDRNENGADKVLTLVGLHVCYIYVKLTELNICRID